MLHCVLRGLLDHLGLRLPAGDGFVLPLAMHHMTSAVLLAATAHLLCVDLVDPESITAFTACRLIALSKNPGVRPIVVGKTARQNILKAILPVVDGDVQEVAGSKQLCAGQVAGIKAGVHSVRESFEDGETEAVPLVDASYAFNPFNKNVALQNIKHLCLSLANVLINTY